MNTDNEARVETGVNTFENDMARLEQLVRELEGGELTLDRMLVLFEEGVGLAKKCAKTLDEAEARIHIITGRTPRSEGGPATSEFKGETS